MSVQELPPRVLTFLSNHIAGVDDFQLLLRLVEASDRWWDAASTARELGISEREAGRALDRLARHNLLDIRITGDVRYQYRPGMPALADDVAASVEAFRRRPLDVLEAIAGPRRRSIRDFANAFRIRPDDDR